MRTLSPTLPLLSGGLYKHTQFTTRTKSIRPSLDKFVFIGLLKRYFLNAYFPFSYIGVNMIAPGVARSAPQQQRMDKYVQRGFGSICFEVRLLRKNTHSHKHTHTCAQANGGNVFKDAAI